NGADGLPVRIGQRWLRQQLGKSRRQRPPAAIIGALVEITIHNVDGKRRMKLIVMQERGYDRLVQVGNRALKDVLSLGAGIADFIEQRFRKGGSAGRRRRRCATLRRVLLPKIAVPS